MSKAVLLVGAGATLSDALGKPVVDTPPLDRGFFRGCKTAGLKEQREVSYYMTQHYSIDITKAEGDSLEGVMAVIYSDLFNPAAPRGEAGTAFRALLRLINRRIALTTNKMRPNSKSNLYRIIRSLLVKGIAPEDICAITFNYDLQIEKTLEQLQRSAAMKRYGKLLVFPACYGFRELAEVSKPARTTSQFEVSAEKKGTVQILKLHGSLNWYSKHHSKNPTPKTLLSLKRKLLITPRSEIRVDMTATALRKMYAFPLVVPPVSHKAAILHNELHGIWRKALRAIEAADEIIAFGYSCPATDQESASLLRRGMSKNKVATGVSVIDPSTSTFSRFVELSGMSKLHFYRNAKAYLSAL